MTSRIVHTETYPTRAEAEREADNLRACGVDAVVAAGLKHPKHRVIVYDTDAAVTVGRWTNGVRFIGIDGATYLETRDGELSLIVTDHVVPTASK